jgi:hypothetical protein
MEATGGGLPGQVDGYDNGDSESDSEHSEAGADGFVPEGTEDETGEEKEGAHVSHGSMRPSFILMRRSAMEAASRE